MMRKTNLASILRTLLHNMNLSESELARQTGVGQPVIHRMASGETDNPKIETLRPIAKFFSVSVDQLIGDTPLPHPFHIEKHLTPVPLITLAQAPLWVATKDQMHATEFVQTDVKVNNSTFAIRLAESTMTPMFPEGTLLIIDPNQSYSNKDFVLAHRKNHKQAEFKQLLIDGDNLYLKPLNPDFKSVQLTKDCKILGVMVQARIDFRTVI
jgi:SOS-response transcriptional repressor LexA